MNVFERAAARSRRSKRIHELYNRYVKRGRKPREARDMAIFVADAEAKRRK